jgi:phasin
MTKSSTPKVAARKARDVDPKRPRTGKAGNTHPENAPTAAAQRPNEKGGKTAAPKIAAEQMRDTHRKTAPKAVAEKAHDAHRRAAPNLAAGKAREPKIASKAVGVTRPTDPKTAPAAAGMARDTDPKASATDPKTASAAAGMARVSDPKASATDPKTASAAAGIARITDPNTTAQFEEFRDTQVPDSMRALAERNVAQTRELYERSKNALEAVLATCEKCFDAAGQGAVALNRNTRDIAYRNINASFDLARSLAGARNLAEALELQAAYWRKFFGELQTQAEELRALSTKVTADVAKPIKDAKLHKAND